MPRSMTLQHTRDSGFADGRTSARMVPPGCGAADTPPPSWTSGMQKLVVGMKANVNSTSDLDTLQRSLCSIRSAHPSAFTNVIGGANAARTSEMRLMIRAHRGVALRFCERPITTFMALRFAVSLAADRNADFFAFLQQHMYLLLPLPLDSLECPFMAYQVRYRMLSRIDFERFHEQTKLVVATGRGTLDRRSANSTPSLGNISRDVEHVPMHGFVCNRWAVNQLLATRLFRSPPGGIDAEVETERLLATVAHTWLDSPPLVCNLDSCSPATAELNCTANGPASLRKNCSFAAWSAVDSAHRDEAACRAKLALEPHFKMPLFGFPAHAGAPCTVNSGASVSTPLLRYVAPPYRIARELFAGLLPGANGSATFGADAMARLLAEPPEARKFLIFLSSYRAENAFDDAYVRALGLPQTRNLGLVRDAAILLLYNNHRLSTAMLLSRLRRYSQRARWLIHSPVNPGARYERKPGYLCGEMAGLAYTAPIWSRYTWVLHTNTDVFPTPEFFARMVVKLTDEHVDMYVDRFPGGVHHKQRFAMEYMFFRTERFLVQSQSSPQVGSAFTVAVQKCLTAPGIFPEDVIHWISNKYRLHAAVLGAVTYPEFDSLYRRNGGGMKTELYPGAVWHNQNYSMVADLMRLLEKNASAATPVYPTMADRAAYPFKQRPGNHSQVDLALVRLAVGRVS